MSLQALFQLGIFIVALRKSQTEEHNALLPVNRLFSLAQAVSHAGRCTLARPFAATPVLLLPTGRQHAPQHPSLAFIHDRSLRYEH